MKIIAGRFRGRTLRAPTGQNTRPTSQRTRQIIFDHLMHASWYGREALERACILDGFAGTGALGLEALSRGAKFASFIEKSRQAAAILHDNVRACRVEDQTQILRCDTINPPPARMKHNLVFLDPPYHKALVPQALRALSQKGWLAEKALIIAETEHQTEDLLHEPEKLILKRQIGIAEVRFWFHQG
ncbi:16S rRNA (guanine(966)-N(2))-methyltransferase RsmD [Aristophania vespae]|uniref:16S rRNA (Guanine(966)-N(2))-methyltransferase RsmD n=1 Tax=Aristophania vespae TaxID=2697033 RepID=A0A6P1NBC7_9PROT|nr:16S rRNA (guanine(966)-N(2))-methyltransferase RsmD [Aristophania vespae]QHI95965.1 16S rRNA (guanine(966)-N(2))-methyltransferase RsmD [Aristophania vespae]